MVQACLVVPTVALAVLALVTVPSELRVIVPHRQLSVSVPEARPVGPVWEYSPQPPSKLTKHLNCRCPPLTPVRTIIAGTLERMQPRSPAMIVRITDVAARVEGKRRRLAVVDVAAATRRGYCERRRLAR